MKFLFDRNMSPRIARMIDAFDPEHSVRHHDEDPRLTATTPDVEWIRALGADDPPWVVVSGDGRILRNKAELAALKEAGLTFFCMSKAWMHMKIHEYAWKFVKVWPDVVDNAKGIAPRLFEVGGGSGLKIERIDL
jgi:hypothetical protein